MGKLLNYFRISFATLMFISMCAKNKSRTEMLRKSVNNFFNLVAGEITLCKVNSYKLLLKQRKKCCKTNQKKKEKSILCFLFLFFNNKIFFLKNLSKEFHKT